MEFIIFFSSISEIYLSLSILIFLLFNVMVLNISKLNFSVLKLEIFSQVMTILVCVFLLVFFVKIGGYAFNSSFIIDVTNINLKLIWLVFCIFSFIIIWRSSILQKLNFFEFFVIYLLSIFASLVLLSSVDLLLNYLIIELQSICLSSSVVELDGTVVICQLPFMGALPCFPPKTKNIITLWLHNSVRSRKYQSFVLIFGCIVGHFLSFGFAWSVEPVIIITVFLVLFSVEFLTKLYAAWFVKFLKNSVYNITIFVFTFLIMFGFTKQIFQLMVYFVLLFILGFLSVKLSIAKLAYTNSKFLAKVLKTDVEAMQIINLHLYCDLPLVQVFFEHSFRGVVFLWTILFSPTVRDYLEISSLGQLYSLYLICLFFTLKFFVYIYLQFGCNPSISDVFTYTRVFVVNSAKYVAAPLFGVAGYTYDNPHKASELLSESRVLDFQNALGVHPNTNSNHATAIDQTHYMRARGVQIEFEHVRDPQNPNAYNVVYIDKGKQMLDSGTSASEVKRYIYAASASKGAVKKAALIVEARGLTEGFGSTVMDDYFSKIKKNS